MLSYIRAARLVDGTGAAATGWGGGVVPIFMASRPAPPAAPSATRSMTNWIGRMTRPLAANGKRASDPASLSCSEGRKL